MIKNYYKYLVGISILVFIVWSALFIYKSSFIGLDGLRYYGLIDDAMISMRYAWNFSHGFGLVWNIGERIEGYSNLLMTLLMAISTWIFNKKYAVLAIQILALPTVVLCALFTMRISALFFENNKRSQILMVLSFVGVLFYYPLAFLTLYGMESGLTTLFVLLGILYVIRWQKRSSNKFIFLSALAFGLAFLTRNDILIFAIPVYAYLGIEIWVQNKQKDKIKDIILAIGLLSLFVVGQTLFRLSYYGDVLPNTYYLKISRIPITVRINDGSLYVYSFLRGNIVLLILAIASISFIKNRTKLFFLSLFFMAVSYLIWTGGDVIPFGRFLLPVMPLMIILAVSTIVEILNFVFKGDKLYFYRNFFAVALSIAVLVVPFRSGLEFQGDLNPVYNQNLMNAAIAINELTSEDATIGVFTAGLIPYYTDRYTIDFLGKSDVYIAHTYPHFPKHIEWGKQITLPGHNKYDLAYSIKTLQPDYIQRFYWAGTSVRKWAIERYMRVEYITELGHRTLILKKDSTHLNLEAGRIIPWGGD